MDLSGRHFSNIYFIIVYFAKQNKKCTHLYNTTIYTISGYKKTRKYLNAFLRNNLKQLDVS